MDSNVQTSVNEDYSAYLETSFNPYEFSNYLVKAINAEDSRELDLKTPLEKLRFDLEECDKRIHSVTSENIDGLMNNIGRLHKTKEIFETRLNPSIERVNNSFSRVSSSVLKPYNEAVKMNNALLKLHSTLDLLRGSVHFLFLVQQLDEMEDQMKSTDDDTIFHNDMIKLSNICTQISHFYDQERKNKQIKNRSATSLLSIKLIRDYESKHTAKLKMMVNDISRSITEDFNHIKTLKSNSTTLQLKILALYILDEKECKILLSDTIFKKFQAKFTNQITKAFQLPRNFSMVLEETAISVDEFLDTFESTLNNVEHMSNETSSFQKSKFLNSICPPSESLKMAMWNGVGYSVKKSVATTMANRGAVAKNLKVYHVGMNEAIKTILKDEYIAKTLLDALSIIDGHK